MEGSIDRRGGLRWQAFAGIKTKIPERTEQIEISNILSSFEREILLLKQKAGALQKQKEGLMQHYLAGRK